MFPDRKEIKKQSWKVTWKIYKYLKPKQQTLHF